MSDKIDFQRDYLTNMIITKKNKSDEFTKSTINYIKRSVNFIDQKIDNAKYLVWSNDFSNLREYFPSEKFTFVDIKENKSLSDFYLLLNCKILLLARRHFIGGQLG